MERDRERKSEGAWASECELFAGETVKNGVATDLQRCRERRRRGAEADKRALDEGRRAALKERHRCEPRPWGKSLVVERSAALDEAPTFSGEEKHYCREQALLTAVALRVRTSCHFFFLFFRSFRFCCCLCPCRHFFSHVCVEGANLSFANDGGNTHTQHTTHMHTEKGTPCSRGVAEGAWILPLYV